MAAGNPYCFLRVSKAEIDLPPDVDVHGDVVYDKSAENFRAMIDQGILAFDAEPSFYVYQLRMGDHVQRGLVAGVSAQEYEDGTIKKHEHTRREKEDDRARHTEKLRANAGPVLLTYKRRDDDPRAHRRRPARRRPVADFVAADGIGHTLWRVDDPRLVARHPRRLRAPRRDVHRRRPPPQRLRLPRAQPPARPQPAATPARRPTTTSWRPSFPTTSCRSWATTASCKDLNGLTPTEFMGRVAQSFDVAPDHQGRAGRGARSSACTSKGSGTGSRRSPGPSPPTIRSKGLDASILQDNLLAPVLGIADPRTDKRIDFVGGIRGTRELEKRCQTDMKVAFALYPVSVAQLMAIADAGEVMPPKSTWFEPKLRSGVVVRSLDV